MTQLSLKEAKKLSIIKWEAHVRAGGYEENLPRELDDLWGDCGFCERWGECKFCEFGNAAGVCTEDNSLYYIWFFNSSIQNAQNILEIIKSIPDE